MNRSLLILGAGGHGRVIADTARLLGYGRIAFLDDSPAWKATHLEVIGAFAMASQLVGEWQCAIVAIGHNRRRLELQTLLRNAGFESPSIIHPAAIVSFEAIVAEGTFIGPAAVVNTGATIGRAAIVNTSATVDHDCRIAPGVHISPGAHLAGDVEVGECSWIGIGAVIRNGIHVGKDAIVGAGAAVVKDVASGTTVVGVPAQPLVRRCPIGLE